MLEQILPKICAFENYYVILANGEFPQHPYLHKLLQQAFNIVCCDGAINKLIIHGIEPGYIIGDCDSLDKTIKEKYKDKVILVSEQSNNDLIKALDFTRNTLNAENIIILGATGLREDHTIGNIAILAKYCTEFKQAAMVSDYGVFTASKGKTEIKTIPGQQISFFSLDTENMLNCAELKWPLINLKLIFLNNGTLNEATGSILRLNVTHTTIVYRAFEIKESP